MGAVRGALAAFTYGAVFVSAMYLASRSSGGEGWFNEVDSVGAVVPDFVRLTAIISAITVPAGLAVGALLGVGCLPVARRLRALEASVVCGTTTLVLVLLIAPWPMADELHGASEFALAMVVPAVLLGLAMGRHAWRLSQLTRPG